MATGQNKKLYAAIAIMVVVCLIASGFYVYIEYYGKEEKTTEVSEKVIDNQISPGVPQAISLEIKRIRVKGIVDHMLNSGSKILTKLGIKAYGTYNYLDGLRPGIGWNKKPFFSYITVLDNFEWKGRPDFETWDTNYINQEIFREVKQDQQKTTVQFTIVEKEKGKNTIETKSDSFSVVYDFRYGNWTGDDYFKDSDGYGHYNGSNYEIWFNLYESDFDGDGIPYWTEVNILGTDPKVDDSKLDPDNDGIPTTWEWKWGYDPFKYDNHSILDPDNDGLQNIEEYKMEKWLADPYHQEIYIESDYVDREPFKPFTFIKKRGKISPIVRPRLTRTTSDLMHHELYEETRQMIMEEFNKNSGITVHIDNGCMGGGGDILPYISGSGSTYTQEGGVVSQYYHNNFADDRKGIFRYLVVANGGGWCHPQDYKQWYDTMCIPCNKLFNKDQLDNAQTPRAMRIGQGISFIHELGHSLGLRGEEWGGVDNYTGGETVWKNYKSSTNYWWYSLRYFGYSDGSHGEKDRNDWAAIDLTYFQRPATEIEGIGWR